MKLLIHLLTAFDGPSGKTSMVRLLTMVVSATIILTWATVSIRKNELQPMDPVVAGVLISGLGAKVVQRKLEGKKE